MQRAIIVSLTIVSLIGCGGRGDGGTGGGSSGTGGSSASGGGTSGNGGGTNGGGTASNGGGTASNGGGTTSNGGGTAGNGGGTGSTGGGTSTANCSTTITVTDATTNLALYSGECVTITGAVVIAASTAFMSTSTTCVGAAMTETFYIQDPTGSEGVGVYKSCKDPGTALPAVGDIVTVSGLLKKFDSSLQISSSSSAANMVAETITVTGSGGMATSGAYPPAGMPIEVAAGDQAGYAHDVPGLNPHPEQVGMALHFANVTVTDRYPAGFTSTNSDGGSITEGFQLNNGVWVDDSLVYHDCIKPLGDAGITSLPNGIKGVWDRYNDYYGYNADGGYAPAYAVLVPMTCADLQ